MPEYTITIKVKTGKRTPFEAYHTYWHDKDVLVKGTDDVYTTKNIGDYLANHLCEKMKENNVDVKPKKS